MFCKLRTNNVKPFYRQILACVHPKHVHRETWWNYTTNVSKVLVLNKSYVCIFNSQQYVQKYMTLLNKSKISICKTIDGKSKVSTRQYLKKISIYTLVLNNGNVNICTKILKKKSFVLRCFFSLIYWLCITWNYHQNFLRFSLTTIHDSIGYCTKCDTHVQSNLRFLCVLSRETRNRHKSHCCHVSACISSYVKVKESKISTVKRNYRIIIRRGD